MNKELFPDFLIIGAGKSGTTSLDNYLKQHPGIFMSALKEPNFFAMENMDEAEKQKNPYYRRCITDIKLYQQLFEDAQAGQIKGETSPMYLYNETAPARIKKYVPSAKLIAILRHPVERLYSRYMHLAREERLPTKEFSDALNRNTIWWERGDLVKEGFFGKNLKRYFDIFPKEQIRVYLHEDLKKKPQELANDIFDFLGVPAQVEIDSSVEYNKSGFKKSKLYDNLVGHNSVIKRSAKKILPNIYEKAKQNVQLQQLVNSIQNKNLASPKLDPVLRKKMLTEIYAKDIEDLQGLIDRDLSHWLK